MKKLILSMSIIALTVTTTNAQVSFGAKVGLNLANMTGSDAKADFDGSMQAGVNFGAVVNIPVGEKFSVQPEAVFSMEGTKVSGGNYHFNYINIPVLAKLMISKGFFAATGPQIGFLMSAKAKSSGGSTDVKEFLNSTDFAWAIALGYLTSSNFGFDARYNIGIGTIDKSTPKDKFTNSVLQLNVFYMFGGKKGKG